MAGKKAAKKAKSEKPKGQLPRILGADERVKRTFVLTLDTDVRISAAARRRNMDRSELVEHYLAKALADVRVPSGGESDGAVAAAG